MTDAGQICLWSVCGQADPLLLESTLRVLRYTNSLASWRHKILFTVIEPTHYLRVDGLQIQQIPLIENRTQWQIFIGRMISASLVEYPYSLCVHADGFPIDVEMWHPQFLDYDYLGAPWPHDGLVGSGGCSLSSSKFNETVNKLPWYDGTINFDEFVCRVQRQRMLELGIRFAPPEVAVCFCTEATDKEQKSFAYHGRSHAVDKHRVAWEKLEAWERSEGWNK